MDDTSLAPPDSPRFQTCLGQSLDGRRPVYGCVIETHDVKIVREDPTFHPENTELGRKILPQMIHQWNAGNPIQPWLYVRNNNEYVCADDYFFMALLDSCKPETIAAQILGEPIDTGLIQKVGPLPVEQVKSTLGIAF